METIDHPQAARAAQRAQVNRDELVERITQAVPRDGMVEPLKGLYLQRASVPTEPVHGVIEPSFCVIAQGSKVVLLGDQRLRYDPAHYLLAVSPLDASLLDDVVRLVRLLDTPADARFLAPLITREIIYRLLMGAQGDRLRQIAVLGGATQRIAAAIERIRHDFNQPLRIEELAQAVGMSVSGFHYHFKAVTAMSPGQFQKQLRLQEARRLLIGEHLDAASAGSRVGYDDASYFTRDYKRLFGAPPMRDVARVRDAVTAGVSL